MTKAVSERQLVELIYAALLGDASWQEFLDGLSARMPDGKSTLFVHDVLISAEK